MQIRIQQNWKQSDDCILGLLLYHENNFWKKKPKKGVSISAQNVHLKNSWSGKTGKAQSSISWHRSESLLCLIIKYCMNGEKIRINREKFAFFVLWRKTSSDDLKVTQCKISVKSKMTHEKLKMYFTFTFSQWRYSSDNSNSRLVPEKINNLVAYRIILRVQ